MHIVTFRIEGRLYALDLMAVREITEINKTYSIPKSGEYVLGALDLRGSILPVLNLRRYLGIITTEQNHSNLIELLNAREQDHHRWLAELEASVKENREFKLTTDPHGCAFGKWYDSFTTHNRTLRRLLVKFDAPHKRIHALGRSVIHLMAADRRDEALKLIDEARANEFMLLVNLFETSRKHLMADSDRLGIVVQAGARNFVLPIDEAELACTVDPKDIRGSFILFKDKRIAILLSVDKMASEVVDGVPPGSESGEKSVA